MTSKIGESSSKPTAKRMTKQRRIIKEILCNSKEHPTAEAIYEEARKVLPDIGLGTVYRNLQVLVEEGSVLELTCDKRSSRYDGNIAPHAHFICEKCHQVYDLEMDMDRELIAAAQSRMDGKVNSCRVEFYGICRHCQGSQPN